MMPPRYRGRFAPSPTGPLHAGSMVAALASWLDARTHHGAWLVRIEDVDTPRCQPVHADRILAQLAACGLTSAEPPLWQSARSSAYAEALAALVAAGHAYPCGCSRRDIEQRNAVLGHVLTRGSELVYPGTCRHGLQGRPARAWRFAVPRATGQLDLMPKPIGPHVQTASLDIDSIAELPSEAVALARAAGPAAASPSPVDDVHWLDRLLGPQHQPVARAVGDFVLRRADGFWSYQLAVVADDAAQGITDVVRGADLADNTARQILLQRALGLPTPHYLHTPLVRGDNGEKLSKQNGASPVDESQPLAVLGAAAAVLGLSAAGSGNLADALGGWVAEWRARFAHRSLR